MFQIKQKTSICSIITGINEPKALTKHIPCNWKCKFHGKECNSNENWNKEKYWCKCKNPKDYYECEKDYICNPATGICENGRYAGSVTDNSVITCDEIRDETKTVSIKSTSTKSNSKNSYILLFY